MYIYIYIYLHRCYNIVYYKSLPANFKDDRSSIKCAVLIRILKFQIAHVIREVRNFQQTPYKIDPIPKASGYLLDPSVR